MDGLLKGTVKFAIGTCITLGAVTVAGSVVAASSVGKVLSAGAEAARKAMKEEIATMKAKKENTNPVNDNEMTVETVEC